MKRGITTLALAATMVLASASVAFAAPSENAGCNSAEAGFELANHGAHITGHYVGGSDGNAGGGKPAHFGLDEPFSPGATFCIQNGNNQAKALPARP